MRCANRRVNAGRAVRRWMDRRQTTAPGQEDRVLNDLQTMVRQETGRGGCFNSNSERNKPLYSTKVTQMDFITSSVGATDKSLPVPPTRRSSWCIIPKRVRTVLPPPLANRVRTHPILPHFEIIR